MKNILVNNFEKIKLKNNTKEPHQNGWRTNTKTHYKDIDLNIYNAGILCGPINNIIVLDVDVKDGGLDAYNQFIKDNGEIKTFTVNTPNGGQHILFNYNSENRSDDILIKEFKNTTKLRGVGLDIRTDGGYIVAPGSSIDGKFYNIINDVAICDMPSALITWLTAFKRDNKTVKKTHTHQPKHQQIYNNFTYILADTKINEILDTLDDSYLNNYSDWLRVSTVLKFHDKYNLWDEWSKKSTKYNEFQNIKIWNSINGSIDINYLTNLLEIDRIYKYKKINYDTTYNFNNVECVEYKNNFVCDKEDPLILKKFKKIISNDAKIQFDYKKFTINETIILKSDTGTGKTTAISSHVKKLMNEKPDIKFLSIVDRRSLALQHKKNFKDINIKSYKDSNIDPFKVNSYVICINSLNKLAALTNEEINNYVIFIDEINSFLELTHNDTLNCNIKHVYTLLKRLIRYAKKVIVSDAVILENVFDLLKIRINETEEKKTLFITNTFKKYEGIKAVHVKDEGEFLNKLKNECKSGNPFLFGCDSATIATRFYNACMAEAPENFKDRFLLLTASTNIDITDAETQFENKFVFFSPCITYGVDFSIDTAQNVYIYQKGDTIQPSATFQQSTRCRNIKILYFYSDIRAKETEFRTLDEIKQLIEDNIKYLNKDEHALLINMSTIQNEETDEMEIIVNSFFILYCYTEYIKNIYKMNMTEHYKDILKYKGFIITEEGETAKINPEENKKIKELSAEIKEKLFIEYIEADSTNKTLEKFDSFNKHIKLLNIPKDDKELLTDYQQEITDKHALQNHLNIIRILKNDEHINKKIHEAKENSFDIKNISSVYNKIHVITKLEAKYNIQKLQVDFKNNGPIEMNDDEYKYIKSIFRISKPKPKDYDELKKIYVTMIKNVTTSDFIKTCKSNKKETRDQYLYNINNEYIQFHLKLNNFSNIYNRNFHEEIKEKFEIIETEAEKYLNKCPFDNDDYEYDVDAMCAELDIL
jgi:hypothetical protein